MKQSLPDHKIGKITTDIAGVNILNYKIVNCKYITMKTFKNVDVCYEIMSAYVTKMQGY